MASSETSLAGKKIGGCHACYLIAEVGTTCMGNLDQALRLIDAGADAGMDAVKFQVIDPYQGSDASATYKVVNDGKESRVNMREMFEKLTFPEESWRRIAEHCKARGVGFFATVDYLEGVAMLERIGVDVHKIGAWDTTYCQLIESIGKTGKPMFVDLGPTTEEELGDIVSWYRAAGGPCVLFMHDFHTSDDKQMNLRAIRLLQQKFPEWPIGFSSPARDDDLDLAALGLGAAYLEKRLILSRSETAFHAHESLEPAELKQWVERVRHVERALGRAVIQPSDTDAAGAKLYYRSLCTLRPLVKGEVFSAQNLGAKRPGSGLPTARFVELLGKRATRDLAADSLIAEGDWQ
jgi:sialic acid synthase SpsE